ncbi:hypothetical protein [Nodularia sphaerocarpa]|uniref:hypothetical protein n=1 Tax=Nodularia sphaerocarpa TaxID=137816 RepID=UPI001EFA7EAA|nr:hypothetical protein [Nodularia sphaerocarpa]MDB9374854.1 hypothetical protein [Nodularia sphaerocarpa CS-585]
MSSPYSPTGILRQALASFFGIRGDAARTDRRLSKRKTTPQMSRMQTEIRGTPVKEGD